MKITKLEKFSDLDNDVAVITAEITVDRQKDYTGLDVFPDELIPDLFLAISRMYKIKRGKIHKVGVVK